MLRVKVKSPGKIVYEDVPVPEPGTGEALIDVKAVGICHSDYSPYMGKNLDIVPLPIVQGHEFGGIIEQINGPSGEFKAGMKVAVYTMFPCNGCYYCKHGLSLMCDNLRMFGSPHLNGGMVEKITVPLGNLVKLEDDFDIKYSALIEPATVAYRAVGEIKNSNVVIVGTGAIGMMMQGICRFNNNKVIAMDIAEEALTTARELGADLAVNIKDKDKVNIINKFLFPEKVDVVVITLLTKENYEFAMEVVRKAGTIIHMSMPVKFEVDFGPLLFKAVRIVTTISYNLEMFKIAANFIQKDILGNSRILTKTFPMDRAQEAYEYKANNPGALKIAVVR